MKQLVVGVAFAASLWCPASSSAQTVAGPLPDAIGSDDGRSEIRWPAPGLRDLQAAIDLAPDGATIRIAEGVYPIERPLFVRGKRLRLAGAGSGRKRGSRMTQLSGPPPHPVVDERGELILRADAVEGMWNFIGAEVEVRHLRLSGFDAAIVTRTDDARGGGPTTVEDVVVADSGRGILSLSPRRLTVTRSTIVDTRWHAIAAAPPSVAGALLPNLVLVGDELIHPFGAGVYFDHAVADIDGVSVVGAKGGGIVGFSSWSAISHCLLVGNGEGGIVLEGGISTISDNAILSSSALPNGLLGDGVVLASHDPQLQLSATVSHNLIQASERAGLSSFGASVVLDHNTIECSAFDLDGEPFNGVDFDIQDGGNNQCGCAVMGPCQLVSSQLSAPEPKAELE